ncbi:MAG: hypothetical protein U0Q19_03705 [Kineosporiaceae bacterium]
MRAARAVVRLILLTEQQEIGEPFEQAVAEFESLALVPNRVIRVHRIAYLHIATGRLEQCRRATDEADRSRRLLSAAAIATPLVCPLILLRAEPNRRSGPAILEGSRSRRRRCSMPCRCSSRGTQRGLRPRERRPGAGRARRRVGLATPGRAGPATAQHWGWPHRAGWVTAEFDLGSATHSSLGAGVEHSWVDPPGDGPHAVRGDRDGPGASGGVGAGGCGGGSGGDPVVLARIALDETIKIGGRIGRSCFGRG